jgi:hypothetical protein
VLGERLARGVLIDYVPEDLKRIRDLMAEGKGWKPGDSVKLIALVALWLGTPIVLLVIAIWLLNSC